MLTFGIKVVHSIDNIITINIFMTYLIRALKEQIQIMNIRSEK